MLPQFDIRTDKWDIALDAMDKVHSNKIAKSKEYLKQQIEQKGEEMQDSKRNQQEN